MRCCKICGKPGHNSATCKIKREREAQALTSGVVEEVNDPVKEEGDSSKEESVFFPEPRKGLWIVSSMRKRIAGKILLVRSNGVVLYEDTFGAHVESEQKVIVDAGYQYADLQPTMLGWLSKVN